MLEFDHFFVFTEPQAPESDWVLAHGFQEGSANVHPGQGTANRRIFFDNAMVEFLWVCDPAATETPAIAPLSLLKRADHRRSGYSPFGIGLRYRPDTPETAKTLPFDTWAYRPPYLPPQLQFEIASQTRPEEPLIFVIPFAATRPDTLPPDRRQPLNHPNRARQITGLHLRMATAAPPSPALQTLQTLGIATFSQGNNPLAEIELDRAIQNQTVDCRPQLSLVFHY